MKSNISASSAVFLLYLLGVPTAKAQENYPNVSMKIDLVAWGDGIPGLSLRPANKSNEVMAFPFSYSKAVPYSGSSMLEIFQNHGADTHIANVMGPEDGIVSMPIIPEETADKSEKLAVPPMLRDLRKKKPDLVALAVLPVGSRRATVLLAPGPDHTFQTFIIDDDPEKLPFGKVRIHNLTVLPITIHCKGGKTYELKPRATVVASPENRYIFYELAYKEGDEWKVLKNDMLRVAEDEQAQMVVVKSSNKHFMSSDGSMGGALQVVVLRRTKETEAPPKP